MQTKPLRSHHTVFIVLYHFTARNDGELWLRKVTINTGRAGFSGYELLTREVINPNRHSTEPIQVTMSRILTIKQTHRHSRVRL